MIDRIPLWRSFPLTGARAPQASATFHFPPFSARSAEARQPVELMVLLIYRHLRQLFSSLLPSRLTLERTFARPWCRAATKLWQKPQWMSITSVHATSVDGLRRETSECPVGDDGLLSHTSLCWPMPVVLLRLLALQKGLFRGCRGHRHTIRCVVRSACQQRRHIQLFVEFHADPGGQDPDSPQ